MTETEKLLQEMVQKLNSAAVGGKLAKWFEKWNQRAIEALGKAKK